MKKKILIIILIILLTGGAFIVGRQVGLNTEDSKTKTVITEETVSNHDIKKTLTGSGQVSAKTTEKLGLTTTKYFKAMCVEEDDSYVQVISGLNLNDKVQIITKTTESTETTSNDNKSGLSGFDKGMNSGDSKNFEGDAQGGNMKGDRPDSSGGNGSGMPSGGNPGTSGNK